MYRLKVFLCLHVFLVVWAEYAFSQRAKHDLIAFVGQKISISPIKGEGIVIRYDTIVKGHDTSYKVSYFSYPFYEKFLAKYKVLQVVQGRLRSDTISFIVFDHLGKPGFINYETVLLFVYNKNDTFYHELYQYFDLYLTEDNRWAGAYSSRDYDGGYEHVTVKPERIKFKTPPVYTLESNRPDWIRHVYPSPYYNVNNGKATAVYGNYVEDLCKLRQQTVIRARRATDR